MEQLLPYLPFIIAALVCPISMGVVMWYMMRDQHKQMPMSGMQKMSNEEHLAMLRAQKDTLEKEIGEMETMRALQAQRDELASQGNSKKEAARV